MRALRPIFIFCFLMISTTSICFGQLGPETHVTVPDQVPPPADAAALGKYGDVPLNMSTGVPNISVPIYVIKTSKLSLPITLNYDASGIKVDGIASWVGLQWSLDAGGLITRTINGTDDLSGGTGYFQSAVPPLASTIFEGDEATWNYLEAVSPRITSQTPADSQPDYFFYNFAGHSGQFVFAEDKSIIDIHHQEPLKIQYSPISGLYTFNIIDGVGNQYIFGQQQTPDLTYSEGRGIPTHSKERSAISTWYLSQIISCDKTDTISFTYKNEVNALVESSINYSVIYNSTGQALFGQPQPRIISQGGSGEDFIVSTPARLTNITFKNGKVDFYNSPRNTSDNAENKLDSIVVSRYDYPSQSYQIVKTAKLSYGYYTQTDGMLRLRLDQVAIAGAYGENGGAYSFTYDPNHLPALHSKGRDLFGYYNGIDNNGTLVPNTSITPTMTADGVFGADRATHSPAVQYGILTKITYPTSGYTQFTYEPNQYRLDGGGSNKLSKSALASEASTHHVETTFTPSVTVSADVYFDITGYAPSLRGSNAAGIYQGTTIIAGVLIDPHTGVKEHRIVTLTGGVQYTLIADCNASPAGGYSSITATWTEPDPSIVSAPGGGLRVATVQNYDSGGNYLDGKQYKYGAGEVGYGFLPISTTLLNTFDQIETFQYGKKPDGSSGDIGCITGETTYDVFNASSIYDCFNLTSQAVSYDEVAEYQVDLSGNPIGKSVYNYTVYGGSVVPGGTYCTPAVANSGYQGGILLAQTDYAYKSGAYQPVKNVSFGYNNIPGAQGRALRVERRDNVTGCSTGGYMGDIKHKWGDIPIYSGSVLPASKTTTDYDMNDITKSVVSQTTFAYDGSQHLQPTTTNDAMSDGTTISTNDYYPEEKASIANLTPSQSSAIDQMVAMHNLTPLIQKAVTRNGSPVSLVKNDYFIWAPNQVYPQTIEEQTASFAIENRVNFLAYDTANGNILQDAKTLDANHSYIWDYGDQYPIAEVKNAVQADIAYTSFEADGSGNWVISPAYRSSTALSGRVSYPLAGNTISKSGLTAATTYVISYWTTDSSPLTITGTITGFPVKGITLNGWTFYEHQITGQTSVTLTTPTILNIDELRLYPLGALMTTHTYDALVGMTARLDEKSELTTYEFDGLQRLLDIKDQYGNIVKSYCYNYAGQAYNCNVPPPAPPILTYPFTLTNNTGVAGFVARFSTGTTTYNFPFVTSGSTTVGVPPGQYTVTVNPINAPTPRIFQLGGRLPVTTPGVTFNNVIVSATGTETPLTIQNAP